MKKINFLLIVAALLLAACSPSAPPAAAPSAVPAEPTIADPTPTTLPSPTADPFPDPTLKIRGEEEIVFDWGNDRCANHNIPDLPCSYGQTFTENISIENAKDKLGWEPQVSFEEAMKSSWVNDPRWRDTK